MNSYGLDSETKKAIKTTVLELRGLLEGEFDPNTGEPIPPGGDISKQLTRYGISVSKPESLESESAPDYLTDEEKKIRERVCAAIKREVSIFGKLSDKAAFRRGMRAFIRQTCYTWINRLLGLRCMEARGLLKDEQGEPDYVVTPHDDYGGLPRRAWRIKGKDPIKWQAAKLYDLQCEAIADAFRQLTQEIKVLFDPEHDHGLIWPSPAALNTVLQKIQELDKASTLSPFKSPDFLGWVYQYFQTKEKDQVFEAASKKKKKIEKDDIIPATTIYTEHYMVEYLVQNTLGRFWIEMHPDSKLSANWDYYVKPPEENSPVERELKKVIEIKLMDPALGSGHFHLVAFDLLLDMYVEEIQNAGQPGWPESPSVIDKEGIPAAILGNNLFGIDIDARSIQISSLVLVMKAREYGYDGPINHLNLVVANSAPFESEAWHQYIQNLEKERKHSVARILATLGFKLKNLDEFGSLLRIEVEMKKIIQEEKRQWIAQAKMGPEQDYLFPEMTKLKQEKLPFETSITDETFFDRLGSVIHKELDSFYLKARQDGLAEEAIMAADAERGFDFARLSLQQYDVVYTNPPYLGSKHLGETLKKFIRSSYPEGKKDLFSAFILRCYMFASIDGYVSMVTQQSWMFLRSYNKLRFSQEQKVTAKSSNHFSGLLQDTSIMSIAHLGAHAFEEISGEVVNCVLFTFIKKKPLKKHRIKSFRITGPRSAYEKHILLKNAIQGLAQKITNEAYQNDFVKIPDSPIIYWLSQEWIEILRDYQKIGSRYHTKDGLGTRDNDRFIRFHWEVFGTKGWVWHHKGGGYKKWHGLGYYCVNWLDNGEHIRNSRSPRVQNVPFYFRKGAVWTKVAQPSLSCRALVGDTIFDDATPGAFSKHDPDKLPFSLLAFLNSRVATYLVRSISPTLNYSNGHIALLPLVESSNLSKWSFLCWDLKRQINSYDMVERNFLAFNFRGQSLSDMATKREFSYLFLSTMLHAIEGKINQEVFSILGVSDKAREDVIGETGKPSGWYPLIKGYDESIKTTNKELTDELAVVIQDCPKSTPTSLNLKNVIEGLRMFYNAGLKARLNNNEELNVENAADENEEENDKANSIVGGFVPTPNETFIEALSERFEIHPLSVYWVLKELRENEGLICPFEIEQQAKDYVSVIVLLLLGYQWPKQVETGDPLPNWIDHDGIIPLTDGLGEQTLLDWIRKRFGADFGEEKEASIESEFANIAGKPLERWLEEDFFIRHVKQFKNRPIAWHIVSDPSVVNNEAGLNGKGKKKGSKKKQKPAFSVMVHYHRFVDGDKGYGKLLLLKNKYLEKLISQTRSELESLRAKGDDPEAFDRIAELDRKLIELEDFRDRLERIQEGKDPESRIYVRWKSQKDQPQGWRPDINDGVKINIAPWERLGMFPVKKIVGKVEMAPE